MPRYELGDVVSPVIFAAPGETTPDVPPVVPVKTDHKATYSSIDADGHIHYAVPPVDPETQNPLVGLAIVLVPDGVALPTTANEWMADPTDGSARFKSEASLGPDHYGVEVILGRPDGVEPGKAYAGQTIHVYES